MNFSKLQMMSASYLSEYLTATHPLTESKLRKLYTKHFQHKYRADIAGDTTPSSERLPIGWKGRRRSHAKVTHRQATSTL